MNFINELRFKLEIIWIDNPYKIMFGLGFIVGAILLWT